MSISKEILQNAYDNAYDYKILKDYSEPNIYNAKGDLTKRWYVYYSFRNPITKKLERQTPIYAGINNYKNIKERKEAAKNLKDAVTQILKNGFNPFSELLDNNKAYTIKESFDLVLELKKSILAEKSYSDFQSRINRFKKWLFENTGLDQSNSIHFITKKIIIAYLNHVLSDSSARNRNNTRICLSMLYTTLEDNEIVKTNLVSRISVLKSTPERNKTYSLQQEKAIFDKLDQDKILKLFVQFISYNFLRPIEVVRLKIKDINIEEKKLFVRAKNKIDKIKIIPDILIKELPELKHLDQDFFLFTPTAIGGFWEATEINRRDSFSKRFNEFIKKPLKLGKDYGLYSFRHTFITKLYVELVKNSTPFEAKSKLMLITGHTSMTALEKYLRDIDAALPEDYSEMIK